jgi:hypothetical protein
VRCFLAAILAAPTLLAQQPELHELLEALSHTAEMFRRTAPNLGAREVLDQRGRRSDMEVIKRGRHNEVKEVSFSVPEIFELHHVVSDYTLGSPTPGAGFHELRKTISIDGVLTLDAPAGGTTRHALTLGPTSLDDETRRKLLENLQVDRLQGAATDFGPILLLFTTARQPDLSFTLAGEELLSGMPFWIVHYRQTSGAGTLTEFRNSRETKHLAEGRIWLRQADLLPLRITLDSEEYVTPKYLFRNHAEIDYHPTPFGLAPQTVVHRQFLNQELLVENRFTYSGYRGQEIIP